MIPTVVFVCLFLMLHSVRADAFSFFGFGRDKGPKRGPAVISETEDSRTLFFRTGRREKRKDWRGKERDWVEIGYKWAATGPSDQDHLLGFEEAEVQFLDEGDFILSRERVPRENFIAGEELYGFFWIEKDKAKQLKGARVRGVKGPMHQEVKQLAKEKIAPTVAPTLTLPLQDEGGGKGRGSGSADPFQRGGITNEEIEETLKVFSARESADPSSGGEEKPPTLSGSEVPPPVEPVEEDVEEEEGPEKQEEEKDAPILKKTFEEGEK